VKLRELLANIPFYKSEGNVEHIEINGIETDSRKVRSGDLFICIPGFTVDGHDFAQEAVRKGAVAVIAEKPLSVEVPVVIVEDTSRVLPFLAVQFFQNPTKNLSLIGVTGTNGKTTITYVLEKIFRAYGQKTGVIGTIQVKVGEDIYPAVNTTPDALELQRLFHHMNREQVDTAIMEVSSHALDLGRVYGCDYDIAIFTNLSQDHLDYHKDMEDYLRAKSLLFSQLGNSYGEGKGKFAILNADDSSFPLLKKSTAQKVITYGCEKEAQFKADDIVLTAAGTEFTLQTPLGSTKIKSKLIGKFNVYNMLAAAAAAVSYGIPLDTVKKALAEMNGVNGRFEVVTTDEPYTVIVDYAHTPDSLENVLKTANEFAKGKTYVVVGCGGDRDRSKRPLMANIAVTHASHALFTSDNPRTEDPMAILNDMVEGLDASHSFEVIADRKEAIEKAIAYAKPDDIIIIAGKGHETYQIIGHKKHHFDDREVARQAIQAKGK